MKNMAISTATALLLLATTAVSQDIQVSTFSFDTGFSVLSASNTQVRVAVGEAVVGITKGSAFAIGSGLLVDSLVGKARPAFFTVSGAVRYGNAGGFPIRGVDVTLALLPSGNQTVSASDSSGAYLFTTTLPGSYSLTAHKVGGYPVTNVNAADALKAALFYVDSTTYPLSAIQRLAADVNDDGAANSADALQILRHYVGTLTSFLKGDWVFAPALSSFSVGNPDVTNDVIGLAVGDVNGDAQPGGAYFAKEISHSSQGVVLQTDGKMRINGSNEFEIPVRTKAIVTIGSISLKFQYPVECAIFVGVRGPEEMVSAAHNGVVSVAWFNAEHALHLKENDVLINLRFKPIGSMKDFSLTLDASSQVTDARATVLSGVNLEIPSVEGTLPTVFALGQNYPNPFNPSTTIRYDLPKLASVSLTIYNTLGQLVATLVDETKEPGYYTVQWNANVPSGIYFYRLQARQISGQSAVGPPERLGRAGLAGGQAGEFVETKKMILLR